MDGWLRSMADSNIVFDLINLRHSGFLLMFVSFSLQNENEICADKLWHVLIIGPFVFGQAKSYEQNILFGKKKKINPNKVKEYKKRK